MSIFKHILQFEDFKTNESLMRQSSVEQMKRIRAEITKQGGDIEDKVDKTDRNFPNQYWINNPFDRHIDTYEEHAKIDIPKNKKKAHKRKKKKITESVKSIELFIDDLKRKGYDDEEIQKKVQEFKTATSGDDETAKHFGFMQ